MSTFTAFSLLKPNGLLRGSYVYLFVCRSGDDYFVKVGISVSPLERMDQLRSGCPFVPDLLVFCEVGMRALAMKIEAHLHQEFAEWLVHGEWFQMKLVDRRRFNAILREVLAQYSTPSKRLQLTKINAKAYLADRLQRKKLAQSKFRKYGKPYRDFLRSGGNS